MHNELRLVGAALLAACLLFHVTPARAGAQEWRLSTKPGAAMARAWSATRWGPNLELQAEYGINDDWTIRFGASYSAFFKPGAGPEPLSLAWTGLDAAWTLDILQVVPFLFAGAAVVAVGGPDTSWRARLGLRVGLGVDYLLSRSWSLGAEATYGLIVPDTGQVPALVTLSLRLTWIWF